MSAIGAVAAVEKRPAHWLANFSATKPVFHPSRGNGQTVYRAGSRDCAAIDWPTNGRKRPALLWLQRVIRGFHRLPVKYHIPKKGVAIVQRLFYIDRIRLQ